MIMCYSKHFRSFGDQLRWSSGAKLVLCFIVSISVSIKEKEGTKQKFVHTFRQILSLSLAVQFLLMIYRHEGLDRFIRKRLLMQPNSLRFVAATKVGIDGLLFGPLNLLTFFPCTSFAAEKFFSSYGRCKKWFLTGPYTGRRSMAACSSCKFSVRTSAVSTPPTPSACRIAVFCHGSSNKRMLLGSNGLYLFYLQWNKKAMGDHENYSYTHCFQSE